MGPSLGVQRIVVRFVGVRVPSGIPGAMLDGDMTDSIT
jgi:hypothetical protein